MYAEHFSLENIPFGIATSPSYKEKSVVTRLGDNVIFLDKLATSGLLPDVPETVLSTFTEVDIDPTHCSLYIAV